MSTSRKTLGIIGAGKVGTALARRALAGGWRALLTDAPDNALAPLIISSLVPDAQLVTVEELAQAADIVVLAVPFSAVHTVPFELLSGMVVVDATNHWYAVDGEIPSAVGRDGLTTDLVSQFNPDVRLVRSLNHLGYHDMDTDARPAADPHRRALVVASDDEDARQQVAKLVDDLGFEPVQAPGEAARLLDDGGPIFGIALTEEEVRIILAEDGIAAET